MNRFVSLIVSLCCFHLATSAAILTKRDRKTLFNVPYGTYGVGPNMDETGDHFEGDILGIDVNKADTRNVIRNQADKWPNAIVPYVIDILKFKSEHIDVIRSAMAEFHRLTCVRFVPHTSQTSFVFVTPDRGCNSHVGRVGWMQTVSLEIPGCTTKGIAMHELMHVLGVWHEHSRYDRDDYIQINWSNIDSKDQAQTLGTTYDYSSIMHYSAYSFGVNDSIPTIVPTRGLNVQIGQRKFLSQTDIDKINLLYECNTAPSTTPFG